MTAEQALVALVAGVFTVTATAAGNYGFVGGLIAFPASLLFFGAILCWRLNPPDGGRDAS